MRTPPPDEIIVDDTFSLRTWRRSDAAIYTRMIRANYESLAPVANWVSDQFSEADFLSWFESADHRRTWRFAIVRDGQVVGSIVADSIRDEEVEFSFWLDTAERGRGVMSRCLCAVERRLLANGVTTSEIHAQISNAASISLAQRCGYERVREYGDRPSRLGVVHVVMRKRLE